MPLSHTAFHTITTTVVIDRVLYAGRDLNLLFEGRDGEELD
jgi:hypothetical protein